MPRLHYFYPENDLALAADTAGYTAPQAAVTLRRSCNALPLWYGNDNDAILDTGINAVWFDRVTTEFGLRTTLFNGDTDRYTPAPWGWSRASRRIFEDAGFTTEQLPTDATLERMRQLSHRRTSAELATRLQHDFDAMGTPAVEAKSAAGVEYFMRKTGRTVSKLPWSSSGRGVADSGVVPIDEFVRRAVGTIKKQGSVMLEPYYDGVRDFALLYFYHNGQCVFTGLSIFHHDAHLGYGGNIVAHDDFLIQHLQQQDITLPLDLIERTAQHLEAILRDNYDGPLGVDFLAPASGAVKLAVGELNLRMTMGHVAHRLAHFIPKGCYGKFSIGPRHSASSGYTGRNGLLISGQLELTPPGTPLTAYLTVV